MAAYAEGFNILQHANVGKQPHAIDAETTPLRNPEHYQYDFNLPDIAEVWRRGSVIASWLLDLTAHGAARRARRWPSSPAACPTPARAAGRQGRHRRGRAGARAQRRAVRALQLARRGRLRRQAAVGDALPSSAATWRSPAADAEGGMMAAARPTPWSSSAPPATWPTSRSSRRCRRWSAAATRRAGRRRGQAGWDLDQLKARARDSLEKHGGVDAAAFAKLCVLLRYVDGDYTRPGHLRRSCARPWATADAPAALPGHPAQPVRHGRRGAGEVGLRATDARVVVEKPFGRDLASARELEPHPAPALPRGGDLPHRPLPRQGAGPEPALLPLRQHLPGADLEPELRRERADHHGRELRRARAAAASTKRPARSATWCRTTCCR